VVYRQEHDSARLPVDLLGLISHGRRDVGRSLIIGTELARIIGG
jgi:hypothetical protein